MTSNQHTGFPLTKFRRLLELGLGEGDLRCLARQGFLQLEKRHGHGHYKVRFRDASQRQRVIYAGSCPQMAAEIKAELQLLQEPARSLHMLRKLMKDVRIARREAIRKLAPQLAARGLRFHGTEIRRRRRPRMDTIDAGS